MSLISRIFGRSRVKIQRITVSPPSQTRLLSANKVQLSVPKARIQRHSRESICIADKVQIKKLELLWSAVCTSQPINTNQFSFDQEIQSCSQNLVENVFSDLAGAEITETAPLSNIKNWQFPEPIITKGAKFPRELQHRGITSREQAYFGRINKPSHRLIENRRFDRGEVLRLQVVLSPPLEDLTQKSIWLPHNLYPFQVIGVERLASSESFLLADEMGTGKTVMATVAMRLLAQRGLIQRALVVCPKSILGVWQDHIRDWGKGLTVHMAHGERTDRLAKWNGFAHVYITTYDTFKNDIEQIRQTPDALNFDLVILDEAHAIKNPASQRSKAIQKLLAKYRWALTGTPLQNNTEELATLFNFLRPGLFMKGFPLPPPTVTHERIAPFFLRRCKKDVFPELPEKIYSEQWLSLDGEQRLAYKQALDRFHQGGCWSRIHVFALIKELKQICNFAPGRHTSPKSELMLEQVDEIVAGGGKVLIFSQYLDSGVHKLAPLLQSYGLSVITGSVSLEDRREIVTNFQQDPQQKVFLGTQKTAGEGITLTAASYVIHFDHWWNPAVQWQAEDRVHRKGQTETVNVFSYWMKGTFEERIHAILHHKGLLHRDYIENLSAQEIEKMITIEDLCDALQISQPSKR